MIAPCRKQSTDNADQTSSMRPQSVDGKELRAELIKNGTIRPLGHNLPFLPLSGPYTPSSGK